MRPPPAPTDPSPRPMTTGRRILRISLIALVVVLFTGYFAFSTFLFSPLEGAYPSDVATLVPRGVDFYASKAGLERDFAVFPSRLAVAERFLASRRGRLLAESPEFVDLVESLDLAEIQAELDRFLDQLPVRIDPLEVAGGRDVALAGYFRGRSFTNADWAGYLRTNWVGKLGVALLGYPGWIGLEEQGLVVTEDEGVVSLHGGQLQRPMHLTRIRDVVVVGTDADLVRSALQYEANKGEDSFGQSARYDDHVAVEGREGDEVEVFLDLRSFRKERGWDGSWPDARSPDFVPAFLGKLFQVGSLNEVIGTIGFEAGIDVDLHGELASDRVTAVQKRLYRGRLLDQAQIERELAAFAPADVGFFACFSSDLGDLLRQAYASLEVAARNNLDDLVRSVWGYQDAQPLLADIDSALGGRIAIFARDNTYPDEGEKGPPHDGRKVLVWALVARIDNESKVREVRDKVIQNQTQFGIEGRAGTTEGGVYSHDTPRGSTAFEYWSPFVSGTGHLATITDGDVFVLSNHHLFLGDVLLTWYKSQGYPSLADHAPFALKLRDGLDAASVAVWVNPRAVSETLRVMAQDLANDQVVPDVVAKRAEVEKQVLRRDFPGRKQGDLSQDERRDFDANVDQEVLVWREQFVGQRVQELAARYQRQLDWAELFEGVLLELAFYPKQVELALRSRVPLD